MNIPFWPEQASNFAGQIDTITLVLLALSTLFTVPIVVLIVVFSIRYRRGSNAKRGRKLPHVAIELSWMGGLFVLIVPVFIWTSGVYLTMFQPPDNTLNIYVVGKQWMWKVQHPTGQREINELHVPVGQPVKLIMTSQDVIHSFYVPAFRVKHDVLPGRYTALWFTATKAGTYRLECSEYCGTDHSRMGGQVFALAPADYQRWLAQQSVPSNQARPAAPVSMADSGRILFQQRACASCHRSDGRGIAPQLNGVYGSQVLLADGSFVAGDEAYIRESILNPNAKIVDRYPAIMPSYQGQLTDEEINELIEYIKSIANAEDTQDTTVPSTLAPTGAPLTGN